MRVLKITFVKEDIKMMDEMFSYFAKNMTSRFLQRSETLITYNYNGEFYNVFIKSQYINVIKAYNKLFKEFQNNF